MRQSLHQFVSLPREDSNLLSNLLAQLTEQKIDNTALEALIRQGPIRQQPEQIQTGRLYADLPLSCRQVNLKTHYFLYVSSRYDATQATPLLLVGHGGNGNMPVKQARLAAYGGLEDWLPIVEERGWLMAAPLTTKGWGVLGYAILFSLLHQLKRQWFIDPDRIYLTGHSMGGHLSWRSALHLADRFAGISPMSGGYDYVSKGMMPLLNLVSGYATFGEREPYGIADANRNMQNWLADHPEIDWRIVEKQGGHEIFRDELPHIADFFEARPRNLFRPHLQILGLAKDRWPKANPPWDQQYRLDPQMPICRSDFHWIQLFDAPDLPKGGLQEVEARIQPADNSVRLRLKNCERLRLYLHPNMLDVQQEIAVWINERPYWEGIIPYRPDLALQNLRRLDDWGRYFPYALDIDLRRMI